MLEAGNNWYWAIDNVLIQIITPALGDLNNDVYINILDIILIINIILEQNQIDEILQSISDINRDGFTNIVDIIQLVNFIIFE